LLFDFADRQILAQMPRRVKVDAAREGGEEKPKKRRKRERWINMCENIKARGDKIKEN